MVHDEFERLDSRKEEVATSQRLRKRLQRHLLAARQSRNGELLGRDRRPHDRIVLVVEYYPSGFFEKTGNLWRAQGRRMRLDFKNFQRYVSLTNEEPEGWRGEIRDGEVVVSHEDAMEEEEAEQEESEGEEPEGEESEGEDEDEAAEGADSAYEDEAEDAYEDEPEDEEEDEEEEEGAEDEEGEGAYEDEEEEDGEEDDGRPHIDVRA